MLGVGAAAGVTFVLTKVLYYLSDGSVDGWAEYEYVEVAKPQEDFDEYFEE